MFYSLIRSVFCIFLISTLSCHAVLNISVNFSANADANYTAVEKAFFTDAATYWEGFITGYRDGVTRSYVWEVDSFSEASMGGLVLLGSAGPRDLFFSDVVGDANTSNGRFILAGNGFAEFNTHPDAGALNPLTIRHELGHSLGIGTLWEDNEVYSDGVVGNSNRTLAGGTAGEYVGAAGLSAFRSEFSLPAATFVPVELDGGGGTAHGHWNETTEIGIETDPEVDVNDLAPTPIVTSGDNAGESLNNELMTGLLSGSAFLSDTSIQSLYDIGFNVVPEPRSTVGIIASVVLIFTAFSRRRFGLKIEG